MDERKNSLFLVNYDPFLLHCTLHGKGEVIKLFFCFVLVPSPDNSLTPTSRVLDSNGVCNNEKKKKIEP